MCMRGQRANLRRWWKERSPCWTHWRMLVPEIVSQASADAPAPSARQLSGVDVLADRVMEQQSGLIGAGLVVAPGLLADEQRYLQWRQRRKDGSFAPLFLDVDTAGDDPYDYPEMEWFRVPAQQGRRMIGGPTSTTWALKPAP